MYEMIHDMIHDINVVRKRLMQKFGMTLTSDIINAMIDQWHDCPRSCVHAGGGHFEHIL